VYSPSPSRDRPPQQERSPQPSRSRSRKRKTPAHQRKLVGPLPLSEAGQRLANLFPNGWDWIYADAPSKGSSLEWETIKKYPLAPIELWTLHQNQTCIIGLRPGTETQFGVIDLDAHSKYHPNQDPDALDKILNAFEDIGLCRSLINRSSYSGGLHIYFPLPETRNSFAIACLLKYTLEGAGIKLRSGQCEIFPNLKRYIPQGKGYSVYNGLRLPMQPDSGYLPLDPDLNPLLWDLEDWLDGFDLAAQHQDLEKLDRAIAHAKDNHRIRGHRNTQSLESWSERIQQEKVQGWTGSGQTNDKLMVFACEARVFMGMDSVDAIATYIEQTALATPGFNEHSSHIKDLSQRSRDVAMWAMRYYWPMGALPTRDTGYHSSSSTADFSYHQAKREAAQHRIRQAIAELAAQAQLPTTATARARAIANHAHISHQTLYKTPNLALWHPEHQPQLEQVELECVAIALTEAEAQVEQDITPETRLRPKIVPIQKLQPLSNKRITQIHIYEGFVIQNLILSTLEALALQGQRALPIPEPLDWGGVGGELATPSIQNWDELRKSLPVSMQTKIATEKRSRQRKDELEQKRRERAKAKRQQLKLDFESRPRSPEDLAAVEREVSQIFEGHGLSQGVDLSQQERPVETRATPSQDALTELPLFHVAEPCLPCESQDGFVAEGRSLDQGAGELLEFREGGPRWEAGEGRSPFEHERDDFNEWYTLAQKFKFVTEYEWNGSEYCVLVNRQWRSFCEMLSVFPCAWLRRHLGEGDRLEGGGLR
jgi:hypothetical protein